MNTNPITENHSDEFDTLLAQSIEKSNLKEGSVIKGIITEIDDDAVVVDVCILMTALRGLRNLSMPLNRGPPGEYGSGGRFALCGEREKEKKGKDCWWHGFVSSCTSNT